MTREKPPSAARLQQLHSGFKAPPDLDQPEIMVDSGRTKKADHNPGTIEPFRDGRRVGTNAD